jgi:hypothetical protein
MSNKLGRLKDIGAIVLGLTAAGFMYAPCNRTPQTDTEVVSSEANSDYISSPELVYYPDIEYPSALRDSISGHGIRGTISYRIMMKEGEGDSLVVDRYELTDISIRGFDGTSFERMGVTEPGEIYDSLENGTLDELLSRQKYREFSVEHPGGIEVDTDYIKEKGGVWLDYVMDSGLTEFLEEEYLPKLKYVRDGVEPDLREAMTYIHLSGENKLVRDY